MKKHFDPSEMIKLAHNFVEIHKALHLDFVNFAKNLDNESLHHLSQLSGRASLGETNEQLNRDRLIKLAEPLWLDCDSPQMEYLPEYFSQKCHTLAEISSELSNFSNDETVRGQAKEIVRKELQTRKIAWQIFKKELDIARIETRIQEVFIRARNSKRGLDSTDLSRIEKFRDELSQLNIRARNTEISGINARETVEELNRLVRKNNHKELRSGLLYTPQMTATMRKCIPALQQGRPVLLVGETGGAKTALAESIANKISMNGYELVSFHGEVNTYQLIGRDVLTSDGGMKFVKGPVLRAIEEGKPLILDEVNAAPAEFLKRLNVIMQLRADDIFSVQENSGSQMPVASGFCIIATSNEKSFRYKAVDVLSAELKNRFGVNIHRIKYPDSAVLAGETPLEGLAIAEAAFCDELGYFPVKLPPGQLLSLVKAAHLSQKIFLGEVENVVANDFQKLNSQNSLLGQKPNTPALEDTVLSPRLIVSLLEQIRFGLGEVELTELLFDWVEGTEKEQDRVIMKTILESFTSEDGVNLVGTFPDATSV